MNVTRRAFLGVMAWNAGISALHAWLNVDWTAFRNSRRSRARLQTLTVGGLPVTCNLTLPIACVARNLERTRARANLHRTRERAARRCGGSSADLAVEPAQLAGTTDAALVVQAMRAVPLGHRWCWPLLIGVVVAIAGCTSRETALRQRAVGYAEARTVVNRRCIECHSEQPTNRAFPIAPKGVMLDTARQMKQYARRIEARVAVERTMPLANMSGMTDEERWVLGRWVETGAKIP